MSKSRKLLLWDIDGTLMSSDNAGRRAMIRVLREAHGIDSLLNEIDLRGASDQRIIRELFAHHRLPGEAATMTAFFELYFKLLAEELPKGRAMLYPGIDSLLEAISQRENIAQGLLTGNMQRGAKLKLEFVGIWTYFAFGAYGDDSADRNELGPFALRRAQDKLGIAFAPQDVFIIGDTPHDIACARAIGARAIAVGTGTHSMEELRAAKPDAAFTNLADMTAFLAVVEK
jgi:phosphoglycolate phosphatase